MASHGTSLKQAVFLKGIEARPVLWSGGDQVAVA